MIGKPNHVAKNIIISLDFDGVLAHGLRAKIKYAKEWFGMSLSLHQTKKQGFEELAKHLHKDINYRSLMDRLNEEHIMEYEIPHGCMDVLKKLYHEGFRFVIITSRNDHDYPYAVKFVKHKFGGLIKYIHNTRNKPKDEFVRKLMPRVHMDDDLKKLVELSKEPLSLFYYRQPENNHTNLPLGTHRIKEVRSWDEFYTYCHELRITHEAICWKYDLKNDFRHNTQIVRLISSLSAQQLHRIVTRYQEKGKIA